MVNRALEWHRKNGGFLNPNNPAPHGLRMLREAVELTLALGAQKHEIIRAVFHELDRQADAAHRAPARPDLAEIGEEMADVGLLLDVIAGYLEIDVEAEKTRKLEVLDERDWAFDRNGVLWRPDRVSAGDIYGDRAEIFIVDDLEREREGSDER